ncbi:MAG: alpha/beta hydrolase, partial [Rhodospirillaceae bacterium]|nr:alpha/beta hydrolase [Rhodospirillaceae bacterium]
MSLSELTHEYVSVGEVTIHYVTAGQGAPLVLLHGWPETWFQWRHVIGPLSKHFQIIAPDLRGLGDTT